MSRTKVVAALEKITFECTGDSLGFSWRPCDRCGSKLGGERHEWTYAVHGEMREGDICTDCLINIEYGGIEL